MSDVAATPVNQWWIYSDDKEFENAWKRLQISETLVKVEFLQSEQATQIIFKKAFGSTLVNLVQSGSAIRHSGSGRTTIWSGSFVAHQDDDNKATVADSSLSSTIAPHSLGDGLQGPGYHGPGPW